MFTPFISRFCFPAIVLAAIGISHAQVPTTSISISNPGNNTQVDLIWSADGGIFYDIESTTNLLSGLWVKHTADAPVAVTNLIGALSLFSSNSTAFFRVVPVDTDGPTITARYPASGDANVGLAAALSVTVSDPSGIDTNKFSLTINGNSTIPLNSPGISVTTTGLAYDPAIALTNWGGNGATVTVAFACADLKGNVTSEEWSFYLAVPITLADGILVLGATPLQSYAIVRPKASQVQALASLKPTMQPLSSGLSIVAIYTNRILVAYTGDTHGIAMGALLANNDFNNIFYRKVTGLSDNPDIKRVTVYTEDVPFTHLITDGSFDSRDFVVDGSQSLSKQGVVPLDAFETNKQYSAHGTFPISRDWGPVTFNGVASYDLRGGMDFSTCVEWMKIKQMTAGVYAGLDVTLDGSAVFAATTDPIDESLSLLGDSLQLLNVTGYIYGIPVVVSLYLDLDLCVEAESEVTVTLSASAAAGVSFTNRIIFSAGTWNREPDKNAVTFSCTYIPPILSGGMEGSVYLYLKPKLTLRLYEAVGVGLDYRRGPMVTGDYSTSEGRFHFSLYDKRSVNLSLWVTDLPDVLEGVIDPDNLPEWDLWTAPDELKRDWYWPDVPVRAPVFTQQPTSQTAVVGAAVTLTASASGSPTPTYQWYQNSVAIPGKTASQYTFAMANNAGGTYYCVARNHLGSDTSSSAIVALPTTTPGDMVLIPTSSFTMGNNLGDGWDMERPAHTVNVSGFYMDRSGVTWAKWQEVRDWAITNGYDLADVGAGKGENHPVAYVNWYDCVKWCNARSQKEGLMPCYTRDDNTYKEGEYDDIVCNWDANGYRLPTEAEREKAARGGLAGKRFPWGDTMDHTRANYRGWPVSAGGAWAYDLGYNGYDIQYAIDNQPYTSSARSFDANGFGLYDMSGNLSEWCWDWFDNYTLSNVTNPHGPSVPPDIRNAYRMIKGGSWGDCAYYLRVTLRWAVAPNGRTRYVGFRSVRSLDSYNGSISVADSFDYPVGNRGAYTEGNDGDGWYAALEFGEWNEENNKYHLGEDWNAESGGDTDRGSPVFAVANGKIVYANIASGWGRVLILRHTLPNGDQVESLYGHLGNFSKTSGEVTRGEKIGVIGDGGEGGVTYTCHLHFEMRTSDCTNWGKPGPGYSTQSKPNGWVDPSDYLDAHRNRNMVFVPASSFQMGDNLGDGATNELPVHTVYVSGFYMDSTGVTWAKWQEVRDWAITNGYDLADVGFGKAENHPVSCVNWYDCVKWCNARSQKEGLMPCYTRDDNTYKAGEYDDITCNWSANGYRLPTEAEREKAARGGLVGKRFPWGTNTDHTRANYCGHPLSSNGYAYDLGYDGFDVRYLTNDYPYTSPVGSFAANGYNLFDMCGNLWEWCWDWLDDYPSGSVTNPRGPTTPSSSWGSNHVIRGGCWYGWAWNLRVSARLTDDSWPDDRNNGIGFRSVRSQDM